MKKKLLDEVARPAGGGRGQSVNDKKICPMKFGGSNSYAQDPWCDEENCAWWCRWNKACAAVTIPDTLYDIARNGEAAHE